MTKETFDFYDKTSLKSYNLDRNMQYQLNILGSLDVFTRTHSENVANLTCRICNYLHCTKDFTTYCTICAYLHDIGKQFIPHSILQKQSYLTEEEFEIMKTHTTIGYKICMDDLKLRPYAAGTIYHHESLDGTGYPNNLLKKDIPYEGQIIRVADEFDAIVSKRQYKSHIDISETIKILIDETKPDININNTKQSIGKLNPIIVKALIKVIIDDSEYEISCMLDYIKYIKSNINRLEQIDNYIIKMNKATTDSKKEYYNYGAKNLLQKGEDVNNYLEILDSYNVALQNKKETIDKLFNEIKKIKKLKSSF